MGTRGRACILWDRFQAGGEWKHKIRVTFLTVPWPDSLCDSIACSGFQASGVLCLQPVAAISGPADAACTLSLLLSLPRVLCKWLSQHVAQVIGDFLTGLLQSEHVGVT